MHLNCSRAIGSPRAPMGTEYLSFPCCEIRIRRSVGLGSGKSCSIINSETGFSLDLAFHKYPSLHTCLISYYSSGRVIGTEISRKTPMSSTEVDLHPHKKGQWTGCISLTIFFFFPRYTHSTLLCEEQARLVLPMNAKYVSQWHCERAGYYITLHIVQSVCSLSALFKTTVTSLLDFFFYCRSVLLFLGHMHAPSFIHGALYLQNNKCGQVSCPIQSRPFLTRQDQAHLILLWNGSFAKAKRQRRTDAAKVEVRKWKEWG